jgi:hypothetical protein
MIESQDAMQVVNAPKKGFLSSLVDWFFDGYWPVPELDESVITVKGSEHLYIGQRLLAASDVADIYLAHVKDESGKRTEANYLLKVSRGSQGRALLDNERHTLTKLLTAAGDTTYRRYLPILVESGQVAGRPGRRINVFRHEPGFHTLEQVHEQHPALDGRHLAWIFKRLLTVLGFSHREGTIHGAVLPCHVLIHAASHGLRLVGWGQSVARGQRIRTVLTPYQDWYPPEVRLRRPASPATDLFLAARCLVYLAGGNPRTNEMPDSVPLPMQEFVRTCLLEGPRMRPDDAWSLQKDFDALLLRLYGSPRFHELILT